MISRTVAGARRSGTAPWQRLLGEAISDPAELLAFLGVSAEAALGPAGPAGAAAAGRDFRLRVPRGFAARMRHGDAADPLLRQVLATGEERFDTAGFTADPLAERGTAPAAGLLHKYRGRALLVTTGACAVHCRYCFRRHFPYADEVPRAGAWLDAWRPALAYIAADPTIHEAILSGGDPLTLADDRLAALAGALAEIPHLRRLRVHTRLPVVLPERVDEPLLAWLAGGRLAPVVVVHANHPREIDGAVAAAFGRLRAAGVALLNQAVLLRGVNDTPEALCGLSEALFAAGALPYYLHLLDPVAGAAHFEVGAGEARRLVAEVARHLPGYLVPRLVREVPGAPGKVPVDLRLEPGAALDAGSPDPGDAPLHDPETPR